MTLTNSEARDLIVDLFLQRTDRDRQTRVGASNLSNPCDRCVAYALLGETNRTAFVDRYFLGRIIGSGVGLLLEERAKNANRIEEGLRSAGHALEPEKHVWFGTIAGYGRVGGSIDLLVPDERHLFDYKGAYRKDIALLEDYLQRVGAHRVGLEPRWKRVAKTGRQKYDRYVFSPATGAEMILTEPDYELALRKMEYKMNGYFSQTTLYAHSGVADAATIAFFARDGNGGWDNPGLDGYVDQKKKHDIFTWTFPYSEEHAVGILARAERIWLALEDGASPADFESQELCFACSKAGEENSHNEVIQIFQPAA